MHTVAKSLGGIALVGLCALGLWFPGEAWAGSPWVLPAGETVFQFDFRTEGGEREFLIDGRNQNFPLNGRYAGQSLTLSLRQGLGANFEASVETSWKSAAFVADPVRIVAAPGGVQILPTFSLSNQIDGIADVNASVRYNAYKGPVIITPELRVKVPTGYAPPAGTFQDDNPGLVPDGQGGFAENTEGVVPVADDLALGTGQVDVAASLLFGTFIPQTRTFARMAGGFNYRFSGPGHQLLYDAKVGQFISDQFIFFVGIDGAYTINEGETIGVSFTTATPSTVGGEFPLGNLEFTEVRIDQNYLTALGGIIFKPGQYEVILTGGKVLDGYNITEIVFTSLATSYRF